MLFGIAPATEEYQRRQHKVIEGLPGTYNITDDMLIVGQGDTVEEASRDHDSNMLALLRKCNKTNLKPNPKRLKLK